MASAATKKKKAGPAGPKIEQKPPQPAPAPVAPAPTPEPEPNAMEKFAVKGGLFYNVPPEYRNDVNWLAQFLFDKKIIEEPNPNLVGRKALYYFVNQFKMAMGMDISQQQQATTAPPGYPSPYPSQTSRSPIRSEAQSW